MKILPLPWLVAALGGLVLSALAQSDYTAFDAAAFKAAIGPKVFLATDPKTGKISGELAESLKVANLTKDVQFYPLPSDATPPKVVHYETPTYPRDLQRSGSGGAARFLIFIDGNGRAKAIYCVAATHREFGIAGAEAIARWKFSPAKIQKNVVPVLVGQLLEFESR